MALYLLIGFAATILVLNVVEAVKKRTGNPDPKPPKKTGNPDPKPPRKTGNPDPKPPKK